MAKEKIVKLLDESIRIYRAISENLIDEIEDIVDVIVQGIKAEHCQIFLFGIGGSATVCESISQDLKGFYKPANRSINVNLLTAEVSLLTQILNDHSPHEIFSRQIETSGREGDITIALSTSGNSPSVVEAAITAKRMGLTVIAITGQDGGRLKEYSEYTLRVPSTSVSHIENAFYTIGHIICILVQDKYQLQTDHD